MKIFFSVLLFLNLTGTYRFIATLLGCKVSVISAVILFGLILWLICNAKYVLWLTRNPFYNLAFTLILFWPLFTLFYSEGVLLNKIALQSYYFLLFTGIIIFLKKYDIAPFSKIIFYSYWTAVVGLLTSFFCPEYFVNTAELVSATTDYYGRAFGFMLQPNMAVTNLSLLFIFYLSFVGLKTFIVSYAAVISYAVCILLTGSRTGIVIMLLIGGIGFCHFLFDSFFFRENKIILKRTSLRKILFIALIILLSVSFGSVALRYVATSDLIKTQQTGYGLRERIENFLHGKLSDTAVSEDVNLQARFDFQRMTIEKIMERSLVGFGLGSKDRMRDTAQLPHASHNQFLDYCLELGTPYAFLFFCFFFIWPLFLKKRRTIESLFKYNWISQMVMVVLALSLVSNTVLIMRSTWVLMGVLFFYLYAFKTVDLQSTFSVRIKE